MGVYYYYINDTKHQYFCTDPNGRDIRLYALGHNIGSRALSYLLLDSNERHAGVCDNPLVGSWIGDRILIAGDDYYVGFDTLADQYQDVGQEIIEMIVEIEPHDLLTYGGIEWTRHLLSPGNDLICVTPDMRARIREAVAEAYRTEKDPAIGQLLHEINATER